MPKPAQICLCTPHEPSMECCKMTLAQIVYKIPKLGPILLRFKSTGRLKNNPIYCTRMEILKKYKVPNCIPY